MARVPVVAVSGRKVWRGAWGTADSSGRKVDSISRLDSDRKVPVGVVSLNDCVAFFGEGEWRQESLVWRRGDS